MRTFLVAASIILAVHGRAMAQEAEAYVGPDATVAIPGPDAQGQTNTDFGQMPDTVEQLNPETTDVIIDDDSGSTGE